MPRPISIVHVTPDFEKAYLRLPKHVQNLATRKDEWFRKDAFDPRLRTHKLRGELSAYWAYSVNREYRVLFRFLGPGEALYYDGGSHEIIVKLSIRYWRRLATSACLTFRSASRRNPGTSIQNLIGSNEYTRAGMIPRPAHSRVRKR
jgi:mRNA-degrading endonuclease RelE of RelBE toxin-antitoxin system